MDVYAEDISFGDNSIGLSYDDDVPYEEQVAAPPVEELRTGANELAKRIGSDKVYLPPDSVHKGKRKRDEDIDEFLGDEEEETGDAAISQGSRPNALYLQGSPITHLPTNNIFAYARHFNTEPVGLEWVNDSSCVLVFPSNAACQAALEVFSRSPTEEPDIDDCITAKPIPLLLWPPEDRINKTLGMAEGLEGALRIRIANVTDKKTRGAAHHSAFYQKHGRDAGKDPNAHTIGRASENGNAKRRRTGDDDDEERRQLDNDLDNFLHDDEERAPSPPLSPPSKMRSDYLTADGREVKKSVLSLLERTSMIRAHPSDIDDWSRSFSRADNRRRRGGGDRKKDVVVDYQPMHSRPRKKEGVLRERTRGAERPVKTRQELDDELDAFLNEKD